MKKTFIAVRDVDEETFRKFKAASVRERLKLGVALSIAMKNWLEEKIGQKSKIKFPKVKPFSFGPGNERLSEEVDEILYGLKK
ncbi:hypothetical protein HY450_01985 [Candidatus Pacearchaeota archaeon]|nr:hypothetical protein [Candidatus Pacearchaeota archaeon]